MKLYHSAQNAGVSKDFLQEAVISGKTRTELQVEIAKTIIYKRLHELTVQQAPVGVTANPGSPGNSNENQANKQDLTLLQYSEFKSKVDNNPDIKKKYKSVVEAYLQAHKSSDGTGDIFTTENQGSSLALERLQALSKAIKSEQESSIKNSHNSGNQTAISGENTKGLIKP